jgi:hypothetical protein
MEGSLLVSIECWKIVRGCSISPLHQDYGSHWLKPSGAPGKPAASCQSLAASMTASLPADKGLIRHQTPPLDSRVSLTNEVEPLFGVGLTQKKTSKTPGREVLRIARHGLLKEAPQLRHLLQIELPSSMTRLPT